MMKKIVRGSDISMLGNFSFLRNVVNTANSNRDCLYHLYFFDDLDESEKRALYIDIKPATTPSGTMRTVISYDSDGRLLSKQMMDFDVMSDHLSTAFSLIRTQFRYYGDY